MNPFPTILEEEGRNLYQRLHDFANDVSDNNGEILNVESNDFDERVKYYALDFLVSHKRVLGKVVKMVEGEKLRKGPDVGGFHLQELECDFNKGLNIAINILSSLQEGITDTKSQQERGQEILDSMGNYLTDTNI